MQIVELLNRITVPLTNEEAELLTKFNEDVEIDKSELSPREYILANQLVLKEVLLRKNNGSQIIYKKKIRAY